MTKDIREKFLINLASTEGEQADRALRKAADKISIKLKQETQYDLIEEQLRYLSPISYRAPDVAVDIIRNFLNSLNLIELTHQPNRWTSEEQLRELYSKDKLRQKALEILEGLRYLKGPEVFDTLLEYSIKASEPVRKKAIEGIKSLADYNIEVISRIGVKPQEELLEKMRSFDVSKKIKYFSVITTACHELLSPTMEATYWKHKTVTFSTGAVPVGEGIMNIRRGTMEYLGELFFIVSSPKEKKRVVDVLQEATRTPGNAKYSDRFFQMVIDDTLRLLSLFETFIADAPLEVIQAIEHDTYWIFRRRGKDPVADAALRVRDAIDANEEYQKYKILIGFEGVFDDWEGDDDDDRFSKIDKLRGDKAREFAQSVSEENYDTWRERILSYAKVESNDMATFPVFGKFLNFLAEAHPLLALRLLTTDASALDRFLPGLLMGAWSTNEKPRVKELINRWVDQKVFLYQIARVFEFTPDIDSEILLRVLSQAVSAKDVNTLAQIVLTAAEHISIEDQSYIETFFIPAIKALTALEDSRWIFGLWFRERRKPLLKNLSPENKKVITENLVFMKDIDYHVEEILVPIAEDHPQLIINLFEKRLAREKVLRKEYTAIPFDLHRLNAPLSLHAEEMFNNVSKWSAGDPLFEYKGGKLLAEIFRGSLQSLNDVLIRVARSGDKNKIDAAISVLRNFRGEVELHPAFIELIKASSDDSDRLNLLTIALETAGVVGGEFGLVDAWRRKQDEVRPWLGNEDARVRNFAKTYIDTLNNMIETEKQRVEERIKIEQFEWDVDEG